MQAVPINKRVESMSQVDFSDLKCHLITIYEKPLDFPNAFVARGWDGVWPRATNTIIMRFSLEECREDIQAAGFLVQFPRAEGDEPHVVETWMR